LAEYIHEHDVCTAIARQKAQKDALRIFPRAQRKRRKTLNQSVIDDAVNAKLDELDREFRRMMVEFPKFRVAYETARVVVQNAKAR
jgi:hypothetical protein